MAAARAAEGRLRRAEEDLKHQKRVASRYKGQTSDDGMQDALDLLNRQIKCSVCDYRNDKDTVLTTCKHVCCYACIKQRIDDRSRKCPIGNLPFGINDFTKIYLKT